MINHTLFLSTKFLQLEMKFKTNKNSKIRSLSYSYTLLADSFSKTLEKKNIIETSKNPKNYNKLLTLAIEYNTFVNNSTHYDLHHTQDYIQTKENYLNKIILLIDTIF